MARYAREVEPVLNVAVMSHGSVLTRNGSLDDGNLSVNTTGMSVETALVYGPAETESDILFTRNFGRSVLGCRLRAQKI